eukprot:Clim_evm1s205 gene=Clim_evmTU1s205
MKRFLWILPFTMQFAYALPLEHTAMYSHSGWKNYPDVECNYITAKKEYSCTFTNNGSEDLEFIPVMDEYASLQAGPSMAHTMEYWNPPFVDALGSGFTCVEIAYFEPNRLATRMYSKQWDISGGSLFGPLDWYTHDPTLDPQVQWNQMVQDATYQQQIGPYAFFWPPISVKPGESVVRKTLRGIGYGTDPPNTERDFPSHGCLSLSTGWDPKECDLSNPYSTVELPDCMPSMFEDLTDPMWELAFSGKCSILPIAEYFIELGEDLNTWILGELDHFAAADGDPEEICEELEGQEEEECYTRQQQDYSKSLMYTLSGLWAPMALIPLISKDISHQEKEHYFRDLFDPFNLNISELTPECWGRDVIGRHGIFPCKLDRNTMKPLSCWAPPQSISFPWTTEESCGNNIPHVQNIMPIHYKDWIWDMEYDYIWQNGGKNSFIHTPSLSGTGVQCYDDVFEQTYDISTTITNSAEVSQSESSSVEFGVSATASAKFFGMGTEISASVTSSLEEGLSAARSQSSSYTTSVTDEFTAQVSACAAHGTTLNVTLDVQQIEADIEWSQTASFSKWELFHMTTSLGQQCSSSHPAPIVNIGRLQDLLKAQNERMGNPWSEALMDTVTSANTHGLAHVNDGFRVVPITHRCDAKLVLENNNGQEGCNAQQARDYPPQTTTSFALPDAEVTATTHTT